jgi:hypothetical protein
MEKFTGKGHLPGAEKQSDIELEIDWQTREVNVSVKDVAKGIENWPGLAVQTFGPLDEIAFRTKGIPRLFTHWWHLVRNGSGGLWGIVLAMPDKDGVWRTCTLQLEKAG